MCVSVNWEPIIAGCGWCGGIVEKVMCSSVRIRYDTGAYADHQFKNMAAMKIIGKLAVLAQRLTTYSSAQQLQVSGVICIGWQIVLKRWPCVAKECVVYLHNSRLLI